MKKIGILNGPNLDRLGTREPHIYGSTTLPELITRLGIEAKLLEVEIEATQSQHEGVLIEQIYHWADAGFNGLIANLGAYTHTSVALRDAIVASGLRTVEVHISNVYKREPFRHHSYISSVSEAMITGLGIEGYFAALRYLTQ